MDVQSKLDEIVAAIESARSIPMSASCVVNRAELLALLKEARETLPGSLAQAEEVLGGRDEVVEEARREANLIIEQAHAERGSLVSETQVARQSQEEADRILVEARQEAAEIRAEADDYVDSKLANFEVVLTKTLGSVDRGREKLLGRSPGVDENGYPDTDAPEPSSDPATQRQQADDYVDAKLASFEAVLSKTLQAVGRGRLKLLGRQPLDDLAEYAATADQSAQPDIGVLGSDSDYVAALAAQPQEQVAAPAAAMPAPEGYPGYQEIGYPIPQQGGGYQGDPGYQYAQADYSGQSGYDPNYGWQQQYAQPGQSYSEQTYPAQTQAEPPQPDPRGLDETSFFDTSMIDVQRLRELGG